MQICVAGWYYAPELMKLLKTVNERHEVTIVAHRDGDSQGLPTVETYNLGLEFGCYNYFLQNLWDGESSVLFMHDDLKFSPVMVNYEIVPPTNIFNQIAKITYDQAYIFQNEEDAAWNAYKHGRMIFMSGKLLKHLKENHGIWWDHGNTGQTTYGPYNAGIVKFHESMIKLNKQFNTCNILYAPCITMLRRNGTVPNTLDAVVGGQ